MFESSSQGHYQQDFSLRDDGRGFGGGRGRPQCQIYGKMGYLVPNYLFRFGNNF